jgi:hypothetical protein
MIAKTAHLETLTFAIRALDIDMLSNVVVPHLHPADTAFTKLEHLRAVEFLLDCASFIAAQFEQVVREGLPLTGPTGALSFLFFNWGSDHSYSRWRYFSS